MLIQNPVSKFHNSQVTYLKKFGHVKTYNQSDKEQLGIYTVKLRGKDKGVRCRFFVVPGDGPAFFGIPDIKWTGDSM